MKVSIEFLQLAVTVILVIESWSTKNCITPAGSKPFTLGDVHSEADFAAFCFEPFEERTAARQVQEDVIQVCDDECSVRRRGCC